MFGFISNDADPPQPLCREVLSNHGMKPEHLQRHPNTSRVGKTANFFQSKLFRGGQKHA